MLLPCDVNMTTTWIICVGFDVHIHGVHPEILRFPHWAVHLTAFDGCPGAVPARWVISSTIILALMFSSGADKQ